MNHNLKLEQNPENNRSFKVTGFDERYLAKMRLPSSIEIYVNYTGDGNAAKGVLLDGIVIPHLKRAMETLLTPAELVQVINCIQVAEHESMIDEESHNHLIRKLVRNNELDVRQPAESLVRQTTSSNQ